MTAKIVHLESGAQKRVKMDQLIAQKDLTASKEPHILFHALLEHSLMHLQKTLVIVKHALKVITAQRDPPLKLNALIPTIVQLKV
jgi:hypothetical protein